MTIEKGKISGLQLIFLLTGLIQGSILLIAYIVQLAKQDSLLVVFAGFVVTIPFAFIFGSLARRFPGMNLVQINDAVFGAYLGKAVSILYFCYFFMVLSFNWRVLGDFYVTFIMPDTPLNFFLVVFPLACAYAVWKGIEVIARISHLTVVIAFIIIISTFLLLLPNMNFSNFLPFFELPFGNFLQGTHIIAAIPFGEIFVFLTFAAALKNPEHTVKNTIIGLTLGAISFFLISIRNTAVLGSTEAILNSPSFQSARLIDIGNLFTRMDILISIGQTVALFLKSSLFYYATVATLAQLLRLRNYMPLLLPVGGLAVIVATTDWQSSAEAAWLAPNVAPIFITPFLFIFPPLALLIALVRNLPKEGAAQRK